MKSKLIIDKLLEKLDLDPTKRESFYERLLPLQSVELSDELNELVSAIEKLHNEKSALANRNISEQLINKKKKEIDKVTRSKLLERGFSENEIDAVLSLNLEERAAKIAEITEEKLRQKFSLTESERIKQEEELRKQEKERADRLQSQIFEIEKRYKNDLEREKVKLKLQYLINSTPKNDSLPAHKANKLILGEIEEMLLRDNAKIVEANGQLKVVSAEDETLDVFDDRGVRITVESYINKALKETKLEPKESRSNIRSTIVFSETAPKNSSTNQFLQQFLHNKNYLKTFEKK